MFISYNQTTGKILGIKRKEFGSVPHNVMAVEITDEYLDLAESILSFKSQISEYVVDTASTELKIVSVNKNSSNDVVNYRSWIKIPKFFDYMKYDMLLTICSIENNMFLKIHHNLDNEYLRNLPNSNLRFYFTRYNDINFLYQSFNCNIESFDSEKTLMLPITGVEPDLLFSNKFSIYQRKTFNNVYYEIA